MPKKIKEFKKEYRFLSNFYPAKTKFGTLTYPTSEHAFVAAKTIDLSLRFKIRNIETPKEAKRFGRTLNLRLDWEEIKYGAMYTIVYNKFFYNKHLRTKLLKTEKAILEEGNNWNDKVWGICPPGSGIGENNLGIILMAVRKKFRVIIEKEEWDVIFKSRKIK